MEQKQTEILEILEQKGRNVCRLREELAAAERDIAAAVAQAKADGSIKSYGDLSMSAFRATKRQLVDAASKRLDAAKQKEAA